MRSQFIATLTAALLASTAGALPPSTRSTERLALPTGFLFPNGIAVTEDGTLFVGSVANGSILRRAAGASEWTLLFPGSEQVFSVTSLRWDAPRGLLWGTSPDAMGLLRPGGSVGKRTSRVFAMDGHTGELRKVVPLPEGVLGNDLSLAPDGGVYLTDSTRAAVLYLRPGAERFESWVTDARLQGRRGPGMASVGPAGIALAADGRTLVINTFGTGRLFVVRPGGKATAPQVSEVALPRRLENPDGMHFAPDGRLLLVEGAIQSGNGRLVAVDVLGEQEGPRRLEVLARNLESPVNLTVSRDGTIWVTEARLRERLLRGTEAPVPESFWVTILAARK
ncbi:hypothetical protein LY474_03175 [Myxococcus stipitatus]|uniref:SMP-30/gluconolactonase/LRE family protein n=1 Tax=Myxococcus stipitatus TaxID=83455 RepID=UPI001F468CBF|nr:hypothetical protein [Myxococcus stipitatus]MCE9666806.1 hypothetical protein [Myxococcus stipitatus]